MDPLATNPFSVLTFIAAPAVLTNAASVMGMSTGNRIARVVDRARVLTAQLEAHAKPDDPELQIRLRELQVGSTRASLLVRALSAFNLAVGSFAASSLISLLGVVFRLSGGEWLTQVAIGIGLCSGTVAVCSLVFGALLLVWETRLALAILRETTEYRYKQLPARVAALALAATRTPESSNLP